MNDSDRVAYIQVDCPSLCRRCGSCLTRNGPMASNASSPSSPNSKCSSSSTPQMYSMMVSSPWKQAGQVCWLGVAPRPVSVVTALVLPSSCRAYLLEKVRCNLSHAGLCHGEERRGRERHEGRLSKAGALKPTFPAVGYTLMQPSRTVWAGFGPTLARTKSCKDQAVHRSQQVRRK
jgi:hypothetical protein